MTESWRDRAVVWPIGRLFLVLTIVTGVLFVLGLWWADPDRAPTVPIVGGVLGAVLYSALMSLLVVMARRRERAVTGELSPADRIDVNRALRTGEAPRQPTLDLAALALIDWRRNQTKRSLKATRWLWGLVLVIVLINMILEPSVFHVAYLVLYLVLTPTLVISTHRHITRLNNADQAIRTRVTGSES